jgi:hypothetical protein
MTQKDRASLCAAILLLASPPAASAACRVTDFTDRPLSSLNELERLSFVTQMTQTEFDKLKAAAPGSANYHALIATSPTVIAARQAAKDKLASLKIENVDDFAKIWRSDFLSDEQLQKMTACSSQRSPGVTFAGRPDGPGRFNLTLTHLTPVGVEPITIRLVASYNIANIDEFEAALTKLGSQDNFAAQTYPLRLKDPTKRAVVIVRAGYETPAAIYIPAYPTPEIRP